MNKTTTISRDDEQQIKLIAQAAGYRIEQDQEGETQVKMMVLRHPNRPIPVGIRKDRGLRCGKMATVNIAVTPGQFKMELLDAARGITQAINVRNKTTYFKHSAHSAFSTSTDGTQPIAMIYEVDWAIGGPTALRTLLEGLAA